MEFVMCDGGCGILDAGAKYWILDMRYGILGAGKDI